MATIKLRPIGSRGSNWSNMTNAHDGNESTCASVYVSRLNYSSRYISLNFDTSVIPSGATINRATLTLRSKAGKNTITAHVDINENSQYRVINEKQSTTITNYTADITSYMSDLSLIMVTPYNSNWSGNTFELYELWIDVDYTASTTYTVRFLNWDNSVISTQTVTRGGSATPPPNPTRDGYTFSGWSGNYTNVTANVDIIAQYTKNSSSGEVDTSVKNIKIGNSTIDKLYLGTTQILKAYLGSILLYSYSTVGDNYQLYTGYPLMVENSSLDTNYGSYITEIVGNTTQGVSNEVTSQQIVDSINYYVPNIAEVNDDGTITTLEATIDRNDITDDTHFIQLKPNTTYIFYCKRIETGGNPSMLVFLGGEDPSSNAEWLEMTTEGVVLTTNNTGKVLIWIPSAQNGLLNVIVQEGTSLSLESSIRSVGVLQGDGTYKIDIIVSNQNGSQTQTKSIYLPQPLCTGVFAAGSGTKNYVSDRIFYENEKWYLDKYVLKIKIKDFTWNSPISTGVTGYNRMVGNFYTGCDTTLDYAYSDFNFKLMGYIQSYSLDTQYNEPYWNANCYKFEVENNNGQAVIKLTVSFNSSEITSADDFIAQKGELDVYVLNPVNLDLSGTVQDYSYSITPYETVAINDNLYINTYANYTKVITDEKEVAPTSMSGNFAIGTGGVVSSNLWDGVSYLPGRVDDNPTWGEYTGNYTDNWSLIDPYGIQYDITASSMRGFTLQFENLTSGKYLNFTAISNQEVYRYPEVDFYFFDSSKTYLSKVRTGISSDGISQEVILTNGEMFASALIPDNATCCEMTFKLTINTPTPYHIEITNINVMEDDSSLY